MGRKRSWSKENCAAVNKALEQYRGKKLTFKQLVKVLEPVGNSVRIIQRFTSCPTPIILKEKKGVYVIPKEPIYFERMKAAWEHKPEVKPQVVDVKSAIALLKLEGYKVLQQDFDLDAALENPEKPVSAFIKWNEI